MEKLHKEPAIHCQPYDAFINKLKIFHHNKGTPFRHLPRINGREIDLLKLYNQVTAFGGLQKVNDQQKWNIVADILRLPVACANFSLALQQLYIRYLGNYEKIHFVAQDLDNGIQSAEFHFRKQMSRLHPVPMSYNHLQHEVSDSARIAARLNQIFCNPTDYDKLCLSLLSGLPNEQELALNVCTILANEAKYMLHLENCPKLVNFLLAQAGIWPLDDDYLLKEVFLESWAGLEGRNMKRFWRCALNRYNPKIPELCNWNFGDEDTDDEFLNLELDLGASNIEGQRVKRIALIFHNLSFEKNNIPVLVSNPNFLRFAVLCMHTKWAELKQIAYNTASNIASGVRLSIEKNLCIRVFFQTVVEGIQSPDRFLVLTSLDVFSKLCLCEANEDMISSSIDIEVYEKMVSFLTVHDIMLLFFTLEALYVLSNLGRYACEKIVGVHQSIGILVNLLTFDPNQYAPSANFGIKLVETLVPVESDTEVKEIAVSTSSLLTTTTTTGTSTSDTDSKTLACNWLKSTYEYNPKSAVAGEKVYTDYVHYCGKDKRHKIVNARVFESCVNTIFAQCGLIKVASSDGTISVHHDGLQKKKTISQAHPTSVKMCITSTTDIPLSAVINQTSASPKIAHETVHGSIIKARMSTPHRSNANTFQSLLRPATPVHKAILSCQPVSPNTSTITPVDTPHSSSNTLIRDLLINKIQQPQVHPNVRKVPIFNPKRPGDISRKTLTETATTNTLSTVPFKFVQNYIATEKNVTDSNDSVFSDGSIKEFSDNEKMSIFPLNAVSPNSDSLSASSGMISMSGVTQANSITAQSNFFLCTEPLNDEKISGPKTSTVTSRLPMPVTVVQSVTQPKSSSPSISLFKSLFSESDSKTKQVDRSLFIKEEICKRAPLLNELLNKGKVPLSKDLPSFSLIENRNKTTFSNTIRNSVDVINTSAIVSPVTVASKVKSLKETYVSQAASFSAIEVQPDQKGVVKAHLESPENSNQSSDLSSTCNVSQILGCTSETRNINCISRIPFDGVCETVATVITTNIATLSTLEPNKKIKVFTPALNQPQISSQSPNASFFALCKDQTVQPATETPTISSVSNAKRPSDDCQKPPFSPETQKPHSEIKIPLLKSVLQLSTTMPSFASTNGVILKPFPYNYPLLPKLAPTVENPCQTSKLAVSESVPVQNVDFSCENEVKTYSSLLSTGDNSAVATTANIPSSDSSKLEYVCEWKDCGMFFSSPGAVYVHASKVHAPYSSDDMICLWEGCHSVKYRCFSLLTHLEKWHCNEIVLKTQALRQKQMTELGKTTITPPPIPPLCTGSVPNATLLIRRHTLQNLNPEDLSEEKESALTKSIRLTSALILRNLVSHSSIARSYLRCYEPDLVYLAMSPVESSRTIAQCLSELVGSHG